MSLAEMLRAELPSFGITGKLSVKVLDIVAAQKASQPKVGTPDFLELKAVERFEAGDAEGGLRLLESAEHKRELEHQRQMAVIENEGDVNKTKAAGAAKSRTTKAEGKAARETKKGDADIVDAQMGNSTRAVVGRSIDTTVKEAGKLGEKYLDKSVPELNVFK